MENLKRKLAVVIGISSQMGTNVAIRYAAAGAMLVIADASEKNLAAVEKKIKEGGGDVISIIADTSSESGVKKVIQITKERYGKPNFVVIMPSG